MMNRKHVFVIGIPVFVTGVLFGVIIGQALSARLSRDVTQVRN